MKKLATWVLAFVFVLSFALPHGTTLANSDAVKLVVDGVEVNGYEQPFLSNDQVLIPVENLFDEAGFKVTKDKSGKVNVSNTHLTVDFNAKAGAINVNGKKADTEFPLTLKNAGNYISSDFLSSLEGFEVEVSEDKKTVNVTTNRVQDVSAFIAKTMAADLKSQSSTLNIDLEMSSSLEEETIKMLMAIQSDDILDPISSHSISKMSTNFDGEKFEEVSETYITEDGFFQKMGDTWVKYDDDMAELLQGLTSAQEMLLPQLEELQQKFTTGINIYEYDDVYVMTQSLTTDELKEMLKEASSLLADLLPTIETEEVTVEAEASEVAVVEEEAADEATEEATTEENTEEATEEEAVIDEVIFEEGDFEAIFDELGLNVEAFYFVSNYDKETLYPLDLSGNAHITMAMGEDTLSMKMVISGTFSNFNAVKEIKVPAEVIKNAISMEEYFQQLEAEFEKELEEAAK